MDVIAVVVAVVFGSVGAYSLLIWCRAAAGKPAAAPIDLLGIIGIGLTLAVLLVNLFLIQAVLTFLVVSVGLLTGVRAKWVLAGCWIAALLTLSLGAWNVADGLSSVQQQRQQYPFVSLASRLSYERKRLDPASPDIQKSPARVPLAPSVDERLTQKEERTLPGSRTIGLERLHSHFAERFVTAAGFGVGRMGGIGPLHLEEPDSILLPLEGLRSEQPGPLEPEVGGDSDLQLLPPADLDRLAAFVEGDFLSGERFGYMRDGKVAGFIGHRLSGELEPNNRHVKVPEAWHVVRIELVSVLKHEQPAVYQSREFPNMERLGDAPTRPLNDFERQALEKLRTDEDLVVRYSTNTIRMLGSLRAGKTCLECHSVQRGELLGAFSYELRRKAPVPAQAPSPAMTKPEA